MQKDGPDLVQGAAEVSSRPGGWLGSRPALQSYGQAEFSHETVEGCLGSGLFMDRREGFP